jgi:hypothetical protein
MEAGLSEVVGGGGRGGMLGLDLINRGCLDHLRPILFFYFDF